MIKNKQATVILILLILVSIVGRSIIYSGIFDKVYPTINDAIIDKYNISMRSIIGVIEDNDCALVLIDMNQLLEFEYLYKVKNGWKFIPSQDQKPKKYSLAYVDKYGYDYRKYNNKNILTIDSPINRISDFEIPQDNLGSNFQNLSDFSLGYERVIWFLVLDELPEDYIIRIGNQNFKIN